MKRWPKLLRLDLRPGFAGSSFASGLGVLGVFVIELVIQWRYSMLEGWEMISFGCIEVYVLMVGLLEDVKVMSGDYKASHKAMRTRKQADHDYLDDLAFH